MAFSSNFADRIWNKLYNVYVPDQVTLDPGYIKIRGTYVTGNKNIDQMLSNNFTNVMIPVISILEKFEDGIEVQIPSREDMITIHKDIELYLAEWREHIRYDINLDVQENKDLLLSLERLSKHIYEKAKPREVIDNLFLSKKIGLINPIQEAEEKRKEVTKPNYDGIGSLVRSKTKPQGRFD